MKTLVFLAKIFPAKRPVQTIEKYSVPTLGTQIAEKQPPRASDDYSHMFDECRRIFAGR